MKKIIAAVAAVLVGASSLFALGNAIEVNFDVPMLYQYDKVTTGSGKYTQTAETSLFDLGFGFDVADTLKLSKLLGIKAEAGFWWPSKHQVTSKTSGVLNLGPDTTTTNYSDCFDMNLFAGIAISPIAKKNGLSVIVTPGIDCNWFNYKSGDTTKTNFHFGVGAEVAVTYSIKKNLYLTAGCPLVWFFTESVDGNTNDNYKGAFSFTPKIGLGYLF